MRLAGEKIGFVNSRALFFSLSLSLFVRAKERKKVLSWNKRFCSRVSACSDNNEIYYNFAACLSLFILNYNFSNDDDVAVET